MLEASKGRRAVLIASTYESYDLFRCFHSRIYRNMKKRGMPHSKLFTSSGEFLVSEKSSQTQARCLSRCLLAKEVLLLLPHARSTCSSIASIRYASSMLSLMSFKGHLASYSLLHHRDPSSSISISRTSSTHFFVRRLQLCFASSFVLHEFVGRAACHARFDHSRRVCTARRFRSV